ncbi:hypothetical protein [Kordiimonas aquimaris]|uniref:hypothetical protein n=1 Tax=Kordiimonas aquimaris TaxID=707591 RepID=UPI0021CEF26C|nr:hypothetical protein [Kordiimonas aquimaris]
MTQAKHAIEEQLSSSLGVKDEQPNILLANKIAATKDTAAITALVNVIRSGRIAARSDCIKVLYEIGYQNPMMIAPHIDTFFLLTENKNNRLVWGAFTAINTLTGLCADVIFERINTLEKVADNASVIAKDQMINILISLSSHEQYQDKSITMLLNRIAKCAVNQLPMYAEKATALALSLKDALALIKTLEKRLAQTMPPSKKKRVNMVIAKLKHTYSPGL